MRISVKANANDAIRCKAALDAVCYDFNSRADVALEHEDIKKSGLFEMLCHDDWKQGQFIINVVSKSKVASFVIGTQKKNFRKLVEAKLAESSVPAKIEFK
jgi:hypothetical protein